MNDNGIVQSIKKLFNYLKLPSLILRKSSGFSLDNIVAIATAYETNQNKMSDHAFRDVCSIFNLLKINIDYPDLFPKNLKDSSNI